MLMTNPLRKPALVLPPIGFNAVPWLPVGEARELPPEEGWRQWDAAVAMQDAQRGGSTNSAPSAAMNARP